MTNCSLMWVLVHNYMNLLQIKSEWDKKQRGEVSAFLKKQPWEAVFNKADLQGNVHKNVHTQGIAAAVRRNTEIVWMKSRKKRANWWGMQGAKNSKCIVLMKRHIYFKWVAKRHFTAGIRIILYSLLLLQTQDELKMIDCRLDTDWAWPA